MCSGFYSELVQTEPTLSSWTFPQKELDLINSSDSGVIDYYVENDAWELQGVSVHRSVNNYPGYDSPLVDLCYLIHLKRRPRFFELNVILPCALLSVVVIAVFCLPCECGEKITLSITILLALAVNNVMISEKMPPSSKNAPILGDYFLAQVSLVMASVFASVLVLTIHHKGTRRKPIPPPIRQLAFEKLAKYFCLQNSLTSIRRNVSIFF
ncbi:neuronal acetylcholine receptor subunit alpha-10-like [Convolutriloba macropyga]|uniref:neuronal acetylcholine receptor subunit alpha-10-like n=1 Tax=Convolutriloba macropyga TaxID=536237 RepID=UPI003F5266E3